MEYWEHKKDLYANPNHYPSPPYSLEKFGELDLVVSEPFNEEETCSFEKKVNVRELGGLSMVWCKHFVSKIGVLKIHKMHYFLKAKPFGFKTNPIH